MGGALLKGWFARGLNPVDVMVVEPAGRPTVDAASEHPALVVLPDASDVPSDFTPDAMVFAVKPQNAATVIPAYAPMAESGSVALSIVAGLSVASLHGMLGENAAVVRAMPNTPAAIGRGISVLFASPHASPSQKRVCKVLMAAVGETAWIDDETYLDAVTAVSGSGPAYVFLLAEALAAVGVKAGLDPALASQLAVATVAGAGALLAEGDSSPMELRTNVTSPGGTTAAALDMLMAADGLQNLMDRAIAAAIQRSKDLADEQP